MLKIPLKKRLITINELLLLKQGNQVSKILNEFIVLSGAPRTESNRGPIDYKSIALYVFSSIFTVNLVLQLHNKNI